MINSLKIILFFVTLLLCFYSYGQIKTNVPKSEIDILINIIPNFQGTELVDHLNLLATSISQRYPDSCLHYAIQASELSDSLNYELGEAEAIFNFGNGYFYKFDLNNALTNYLAALRIFEKFGDSDSHGNLLLQIGFINTFVGNHEKSVEYYRRAQFIFNKTGNHIARLFSEGKIRISFLFHLQNYDSALVYSNQLLVEYKQLGFELDEVSEFINLGNVYQAQNDGYKSLPYYDNALKKAREINDLYGIGMIFENLGNAYLNNIDKPYYQEAEKYYSDAIQFYKLAGRYEKLPSIYLCYANLQLKMRNYNTAGKYLNMGVKAVNDYYAIVDTLVYEIPDGKYRFITRVKLVLSEIYLGYSELFEQMGDYNKALYYNKLANQSEDSIYIEASRRSTEVVLANAENESITQKVKLLEKEKELQEERAQRSILLLIGSGVLVVFIVLIAILYIRQNKLKTEQDKTTLQQKLLRTQMNPHFLFNSLASIQHYIIKEKPTMASDYVGRFSKLVRQILNNSVEEWITLEDEIGSIENYLELQKVRYRDMFEYTLEMDEEIDPETTLVPPMLAQPFIENSIEHGFKHKEDKGKMRLRFSLNGNLIHFELEDDGVGREKAMKQLQSRNNDHRSMSTEITRERLKVLNKKLKQKINLAITDLKDDQGNPAGTKVVFDIPIKT